MIPSSTTPESAEFLSLIDVPKIDFNANIQAARAAGVSLFKILKDLWTLKKGPGRIGREEYFYYRLWDPAMTPEFKRSFAGRNAQIPIHLTCNALTWYATAADKLLYHMVMQAVGMPIPDLIGLIHKTRTVKGVPILKTEQDIAGFLRDETHYPLFIKPLDGRMSLFVVNAEAFNKATDEVVLKDGSRNAAELAAELATHSAGYLIQKRLSPAPELEKKFGPSLWSLRVIVLTTPGAAKPSILGVVAKIATGDNPADNYWRSGNMLGAVDLDSGRIIRVVRGSAAGIAIGEPHPDTGEQIGGTVIPGWQGLKELVLSAALTYPEIRIQGWDVALSDRGPVLLEANCGSDFNLPQLAYGVGILDDRFVAHLKACNYDFNGRWPPR